MKIRLLTGLLACTQVIFGQIVPNPSFEGTPRTGIPPDHWSSCNVLSTPDTQPGSWQVSKPASEGETYVSIVARGNNVEMPNTVEDIQVQLNEKLIGGATYNFTVTLSYSDNFQFNSIFYTTPMILRIAGGQNSCQSTEILWESPLINHTEWRTYIIDLNHSVDIDYLVFEGEFENSPASGNILIDNIILECPAFELNWVSDTTICEHESLLLDVTIPNGVYKWSDETTDPINTINNQGLYTVDVSNGCSSEIFEIDLSTRNCFCDTAEPIQTVSFDSLKCESIEIMLDADTPGGIYRWSTGSDEPSIEVQAAGIYTVDVSNNCETLTFDFLIETIECSCEISAPNVFTPNGDGLNDEFEITGSTDITDYRIKVYDRLGEKVFESDQLGDNMNGQLNGSLFGKELPAGVYYYAIDIVCTQGSLILENSFNGWVTIIR